MSIKQRVLNFIIENAGKEILKEKTFIGNVEDILDLYSNLFDSKIMKYLEKCIKKEGLQNANSETWINFIMTFFYPFTFSKCSRQNMLRI